MKRIALLFAAAVLFAGHAEAADTFGKTNVRTAAASDAQAQITGSDGSSLAQVAASNGAAAGNGLFVLGGAYNSSLPTNTNGRSVALQTDINGRLIITQDTSAANLLVNLKQIGGSSLALGQTTMSASLPVTIASNQGAISVTSGAPTGSSFNNPAVTNIAAAGTSTIVCKTGLAVSQPTKPMQFTISAPGAVRCQLQFNDNSSLTKFASVVTAPGAPTVVWTPPSGVVGLTTSSTVTTLQYEASCTNFDQVAQDVSCAVVYCQAASGC